MGVRAQQASPYVPPPSFVSLFSELYTVTKKIRHEGAKGAKFSRR